MRTPNPSGWMWEHACEMLERAERMQRQFFQVRAELRGPSWEPPVDIVETDRELTIVVALPGVRSGDMDVLIDGSMLLVRGARALPSIADSGVIHRLEIPHGRFERRIVLQSGRLELTRREVADGCLLLRFTKLG
jgi:HSP20 family molecular chaperone IbpA